MLGTIDGAAELLVTEGYATAATLHEATGRPVAVAFDARNLVHVVRALRTAHPALPLLLCGDNDNETEARTGKNPGREGATKAARAVHTAEGPAGVLLPVFAPGQQQGRTDFNDLAAVAEPDAVRAALCPEPVACINRVGWHAPVVVLHAGCSGAAAPALQSCCMSCSKAPMPTAPKSVFSR